MLLQKKTGNIAHPSCAGVVQLLLCSMAFVQGCSGQNPEQNGLCPWNSLEGAPGLTRAGRHPPFSGARSRMRLDEIGVAFHVIYGRTC